MSTTTLPLPPVKISFEAYDALKGQAQYERRTLSQVASYAILEYIRAQREREQRT